MYGLKTIDAQGVRQIEVAISPKIAGSTILALSIDVYIIEQFDLEFNFSSSSKGGGLYYHFPKFKKDKDYNFYCGISKGISHLNFLNYVQFAKLYLPIGINYFSKKEHLNVAIDVGYLNLRTTVNEHSLLQSYSKTQHKEHKISAGVKIGFRF